MQKKSPEKNQKKKFCTKRLLTSCTIIPTNKENQIENAEDQSQKTSGLYGLPEKKTAARRKKDRKDGTRTERRTEKTDRKIRRSSSTRSTQATAQASVRRITDSTKSKGIEQHTAVRVEAGFRYFKISSRISCASRKTLKSALDNFLFTVSHIADRSADCSADEQACLP